jgi:hypothetical protein
MYVSPHTFAPQVFAFSNVSQSPAGKQEGQRRQYSRRLVASEGRPMRLHDRTACSGPSRSHWPLDQVLKVPVTRAEPPSRRTNQLIWQREDERQVGAFERREMASTHVNRGALQQVLASSVAAVGPADGSAKVCNNNGPCDVRFRSWNRTNSKIRWARFEILNKFWTTSRSGRWNIGLVPLEPSSGAVNPRVDHKSYTATPSSTSTQPLSGSVCVVSNSPLDSSC